MTTKRKPFFGTYELLLKVFGAAIKFVMSRPPHFPKTRRGCSARGPWGRHRGSEFRGYRRAAARGANSYAEHDLLVRNFGAVSTRDFERDACGPVSAAMSKFQRVFREHVGAGIDPVIAESDARYEAGGAL